MPRHQSREPESGDAAERAAEADHKIALHRKTLPAFEQEQTRIAWKTMTMLRAVYHLKIVGTAPVVSDRGFRNYFFPMVFEWEMGYRMFMPSRMKVEVFLAVVSILATASAGGIPIETPANRSYQTIVDRNPFNLKPPPPPAAATAPEAPPPPKVEILLTGYSTITKPKRAYLMSKEANKKDPYFSLAEGQAKDGIEVLEIDEKTKSVKIRNAGVENVLTFAKNGVTNPPAIIQPPPGMIPGQPGGPGTPGQPQAFFPNYQNNNVAPGANNPTGPVRSIPSRTLRTQPEPQPNMSVGAGVTPAIAPLGQPQGNAPSMSTEEQYLLLKANEVQQQKSFQKGLAPAPFPPLPPLY